MGREAEKIIIFTRYPAPGKTKTRLIPALGADGAALLYRNMTQHAMDVVKGLAKTRDFSLEIRYYEGNRELISKWLGIELFYREQTGPDLGERMWRAFQDAFQEGRTRVLIIGCDCPGIHGEILETALERLAEYDLVLGPANDGGYYLVGLSTPCRPLFRNVTWGSNEVLAQTLTIARECGLSVGFVDALDDIDRPEDLLRLNAEKWMA